MKAQHMIVNFLGCLIISTTQGAVGKNGTETALPLNPYAHAHIINDSDCYDMNNMEQFYKIIIKVSNGRKIATLIYSNGAQDDFHFESSQPEAAAEHYLRNYDPDFKLTWYPNWRSADLKIGQKKWAITCP